MDVHLANGSNRWKLGEVGGRVASRAHDDVRFRNAFHVDVFDLGCGVIYRHQLQGGRRLVDQHLRLAADQHEAAAAARCDLDDPNPVVEDLGKSRIYIRRVGKFT